MSHALGKRVVIKIGSALIAPEQDGCRSENLLHIAQFIVNARRQGCQVVLVSSGAVAAGAHHFKASSTASASIKKAMAAAGQTAMIALWDRFFDFPCAQLLLTQADLTDRDRYTQIRQTLFTLLDQGILPIINENDAVMPERLKVGDNDNLSAMIATVVDADTLVLCTDVDGLYDKNPHRFDDASLIKEVSIIGESIKSSGEGSSSSVGTGGMKTKLEAAEKATALGISTYIINGFKDSSFKALLEDSNPGTLFLPHNKPLEEGEHWMVHTAKAHGELVISEQTASMLRKQELAMTCQDINAVEGAFAAGETVLIKNEQGQAVAKASSNYSSCLLRFVLDNGKALLPNSAFGQLGDIVSLQDIAILEK
jgi:glutamate 5-kinase